MSRINQGRRRLRGSATPAGVVVAPAAQAKVRIGNVILDGTADRWLQAPRYRAGQLASEIGATGKVS